MCAQRRIGLYGGTFDPVHQGHLDVARRVGKLFEIDEILFVPAQLAPHKLGRPVTPAIHRYAMLVLATKDDEQLRISTFELDAPDRRYTCLLYTSDAADERSSVDLGGRRII